MTCDKAILSPGLACKYMLIINGVINTPAKLETAALKIAEPILPPEIDTITTDDDTVDGKLARKIIPVFNTGSKLLGKNRVMIYASAGKSRNVEVCINACNR